MTSEDPQAAAGTCQIPDTYTRRWTPRRVEKPVEGPETAQPPHRPRVASRDRVAVGGAALALPGEPYPTPPLDIPSSPEGRRELANRPHRRWAVCRTSRSAALLTRAEVLNVLYLSNF